MLHLEYIVMKQKGSITKFGLWFLPTWNEVFVYIFLVLLTYVISNVNSVEQTLEIQKSTLTIQNIILSPVDWTFNHVGGATFARIVPQALFWGFVGFLVYGLVLFVQSFANEVLNDVSDSTYIKPPNINRWSAARESIEKFTIRFFVLALGIAYTIVFFRWILPTSIEQFRITSQYKSWNELGNGVLIFLIFGLCLHVFTILARFIKLKRPTSY